MCGIVGFVYADSARPAERDILERMNRAIFHRGPDEAGTHLFDNVAMAMRRLAIIDLSGGQQPISNEDGTIHVVFNGEIYNFKKLRAELEKDGHRFTTKCDTEVLVHGYEQWGVKDLCRRLNGMFAFSIWDDRNKRLTIARDRVGKKPLHYLFREGLGLLWASEIKSLLEHPEVEAKPNYGALSHYLTIQGVPEPMSAFEEIAKIPPSAILEWEPNSRQEPRLTTYWKSQYLPKFKGSEEQAAAELRDIVTDAVRCRLISEVPLGSFLSGGVDSSIIVGLMASMSDRPVKTFTIGFEEAKFSEANHARRVSDFYATEHHEEIVRWNLQETLPRMVSAIDEPLADPAALALWHLSEMTRKHVTVALCGDGGDETHGGYQRHLLDGFVAPANGIAGSALGGLIGNAWEGATSLIPVPRNLPPERNWLLGIQRLGQVLRTPPEASILRWSSYFDERAKKQLVHGRLLDGSPATESLFVKAAKSARANNQLDRTLAADLDLYLASVLLVKSDRMTMAHSLEARSPFLDVRHMEFSAKLPTNWKIHGRTQKYLLKRAFRDILPTGIAERAKQGFALPVGEWLRGPLRPYVHELLLSKQSRQRGLYRQRPLQQLIAHHESGKADHGKRIWALLVLELWFRQYIDRSSPT